MENNTNKLAPLQRLIPMISPSGNTPNMEVVKIVTGDVWGPGVMKLDSGSWTGHAAKAACIARVTNVARVAGIVRAANAARVGNALRVGGVVRAGCAASMKCENQECGCPSGDGA